MSDKEQKTSKASEHTNEAWEMTLSVVEAMEQTYQKAVEEHQAALAAAEGNPFAPGIAAAWHLRDALDVARKTLKADIYKIGRANGRPITEALR